MDEIKKLTFRKDKIHKLWRHEEELFTYTNGAYMPIRWEIEKTLDGVYNIAMLRAVNAMLHKVLGRKDSFQTLEEAKEVALAWAKSAGAKQ